MSNDDFSPREKAEKVAAKLQDLMLCIRKDVDQVNEPQAKALFEAAAELLYGLKNAFEHYQRISRPRWN